MSVSFDYQASRYKASNNLPKISQGVEEPVPKHHYFEEHTSREPLFASTRGDKEDKETENKEDEHVQCKRERR